jgi:hypothetical protein
VDQFVSSSVRRGEKCIDEGLSACRADSGIEVGDRLAENEVGGDVPAPGAQELLVLSLGLAVVWIALVGKGNSGPSIDKDHWRLGVP